MLQIGSNWFKLDQTCLNMFKLDQNVSKCFKLDLNWSNLFKNVYTGSNLFKLVQTCSNLFKLAQTCLARIFVWMGIHNRKIKKYKNANSNLILSHFASSLKKLNIKNWFFQKNSVLFFCALFWRKVFFIGVEWHSLI